MSSRQLAATQGGGRREDRVIDLRECVPLVLVHGGFLLVDSDGFLSLFFLTSSDRRE